MSTPARSPNELTREIIAGLNVKSEFEALGVKMVGQPRASGFLSCYAVGREDRRPSGFVNVQAAIYGDSGNGADAPPVTMSLFDFAVHVGKYPDWREARKAFAAKAGMKLGSERRGEGTDWRERLELEPWTVTGNAEIALRWCLKAKPGTSVDAIRAAGGQLAYLTYRDKKTKEKVRIRSACQVVALPCYGTYLLEAPPVAYVAWKIDGSDFDKTPHGQPKSEPRILAKMSSFGPTAGTFMNLSALMVLSDPEQRAGVKAVFKVEGPTCMMALMTAIPPELRGQYLAITNAGGCGADVGDHQVKLLAGLNVVVVPDADAPGLVGAHKWLRALAPVCESVKLLRLPFTERPKGGLDLRDWMNGFAEEIEGQTP